MSSFFSAHFSNEAVQLFDSQFLNAHDHANAPTSNSSGYSHIPGLLPFPNIDLEEGGDDGLGYYSDGVKRTLTDEQIEIFRHSELYAMRRTKRQRISTERQGPPALFTKGTSHMGDVCEDDAHNSPELADARSRPVRGPAKKRKRRNKLASQAIHEPKIDLRKRTWDVVEAGLDSLDYD